jgi:hypothetical protein
MSSVVKKLSKAMESDHSNSSKRQIDNIDVPPFEYAQANENPGEEQDFSTVTNPKVKKNSNEKKPRKSLQ